MKGIVTTELFSPDGRLLRIYRQPSRSLVLSFMKILYCQFTHSSWAKQTSGEQQHHMRMTAAHGRGINAWERNSWAYSDNLMDYPNFIGECYGIQITTDDTPVGPEDTRLKGRIGQGAALWKGARVSNYRVKGVCSDHERFYWAVDGYGQEIHRQWLYGGLVNTWYVGNNPQGCTYDGTYLWYSDSYTDTIYQVNAASGAVVNSWASPSTEPRGLAWDFTNSKIFSCDENTDLIYRHNPTTGAVEDSWAAPAANPRGMEWLDDYLWIVCSNRVLYKVDPVTHATVKTTVLPPYWGGSYSYSPEDPWGIAFDGLNWLLSDDTTYASLWWMYFPEDETNVEYSGMEIMIPTFSDPNGSMVIRRYFTNNSGGDVTIRKVGIHTGARPELIATDVLGSPITIGNGQVLRVSYTFQITV